MAEAPSRPRIRRHAQQGISLLFALMALVIMGLGAVALTRSVDTSPLVMGNLSFHQDTVIGSASAAEQAMSWLDANKAGVNLDNDRANSGYYASHVDALDVRPVEAQDETVGVGHLHAPRREPYNRARDHPPVLDHQHSDERRRARRADDQSPGEAAGENAAEQQAHGEEEQQGEEERGSEREEGFAPNPELLHKTRIRTPPEGSIRTLLGYQDSNLD